VANWKFKIDVKDAWDKAQNEEITSIDFAKVLVKELKRIEGPITKKLGEESAEVKELIDLIDEFEGFIQYEKDDDREFNYIFEELYDWGDYEVAPLGEWPPNKLCWIGAAV
jgi:hypothetical protein